MSQVADMRPVVVSAYYLYSSTCLENLDMLGNLITVREMPGNYQGKNLVRENVSLNVSGL